MVGHAAIEPILREIQELIFPSEIRVAGSHRVF
jgi:hypothetical protein